jgi:16S rRNA (guanine966-N2)-methyltransferase
MRIIAGQWRGRRIGTPRDRRVRPTPDRVREALFSVLGPAPLAAEVLDLFAGTGALGLEALSRGAPSATFVERSREALRLIRENVEILGASDRVRILDRSAFAIRFERPEIPACSLALIDPPYTQLEDVAGRARLAALLARLAAGDALLEGAVVVLEHRSSVEGPVADGLAVSDRRVYGETGLTIYEKRPG